MHASSQSSLEMFLSILIFFRMLDPSRNIVEDCMIDILCSTKYRYIIVIKNYKL
jgi:hypothetical protein